MALGDLCPSAHFGATAAMLGLYLDALGAIGIARGLMLKTLGDIEDESRAAWNRSSRLAYSLIVQKLEAMLGALFLVVGFGLQAVANLAPSPGQITICLVPATAAGVGIFAIWVLLFYPFRRQVSNYVYLVMVFGDRAEKAQPVFASFRKQTTDAELAKSQVYQVLERYCGFGKPSQLTVAQWVEELEVWLADGPRVRTQLALSAMAIPQAVRAYVVGPCAFGVVVRTQRLPLCHRPATRWATADSAGLAS